MIPHGEFHKVDSGKSLRLARRSLAHHLPTDGQLADPALTAIIEAWPALPEAVKAGIVAMVQAATKGACR